VLSQPASHHSWRCGCLPAGDWQAANGKPVPLLVQGQTLRQELTGKLMQIDANWCKLMQIDANYLNAVIKLSWQLIWFKHTSAMKWSSFKMDTRGKWQKPCRSWIWYEGYVGTASQAGIAFHVFCSWQRAANGTDSGKHNSTLSIYKANRK
jgi:hypothetical protein